MASGDVKVAYQAVQTMTVTALHSLASSATAGWQSAVIDNSANLYENYLVQVVLDFANTAPANDRIAYLYAYSSLATAYTNPASGSEGTITLTSVSTTPQNLRLLGSILYNTADEIVESHVFDTASIWPGGAPPALGFVIMNFTGAALAASGNTVKYAGYYRTVAA